MSLLPVGISGEEAGYQIERSLRFNSADSAYLNRTPASAGNRKTWTWSGWVKRGALGTTQWVLAVGGSATEYTLVRFNTTDTLEYVRVVSSAIDAQKISTAVYRDPSAWYHIVIVEDAVNTVARIYVNGSEVVYSTNDNPSNVNGAVNNTVIHTISGVLSGIGTAYFNGYLTEINFIDGQALDPTSFGEFNSDTGVWQPKAYTGSYGTNGFYLNFSDNSGVTSTTLGADSSGNGNNWTPNNFSVTAGAGNDSLVDTPTNYGTDTGVGGEVRGNYATWNPLSAPAVPSTLTNGNLTATTASTAFSITSASMAMRSGKWYCEIKFSSLAIGAFVGIRNSAEVLTSYVGGTSGSYGYYSTNGNKYNSGTATAYGSSYTTAQTIGIAFDADAGTLTFYRDNVSQGVAYSSIPVADYVFALSDEGTGSVTCDVNFGQRPFAYTAPSGFKALCTQNLPEPTIVDGGEYFNTVLYTGNGSTQSITGVGFQPDFVWAKMRSDGTRGHALFDAVRGGNERLDSSSTQEERDNEGNISFETDGFNVTSSHPTVNDSGDTAVAWNWKANGAGVSNTDGTITSTVSANTDSGFSIVTYTGTGSAATVGHGLGVAPRMVIVKNRSVGSGWRVYHSNLTSAAYVVYLNATNAQTLEAVAFNSTAPTSSVFSVGASGDTNGSGNLEVAYCFAQIPGYSAAFSYTGNGSSDGPFVFLNFRPAFVLWKNASVAEGWLIEDAVRSPFNQVALELYPHSSSAEAAGSSRSPTQQFDFLSNGFKVRGAQEQTNGSGNTIIGMAFAEVPFRYSLAR